MSAIKKLEKFSGVGCVERWIDKFEFALVVDEVTDATKCARLLAMNLESVAYDSWKGMEWKNTTGTMYTRLRRC